MEVLQLINLIAAYLSIAFVGYWVYQKSKIPKYNISADFEDKSLDGKAKELAEAKVDILFRLEQATYCDTRIMVGFVGFLTTQLIDLFVYG